MSEELPVYHFDKSKMHQEELKSKVALDVLKERHRQDAKWGEQHHDHGTWLKIFIEEVGEVAQAMQADTGWGKSTDASNLYNELIQASAVAQAIAEQVLVDED